MFNAVTELVVADNAQLRYVCGQALSERSWIFGAQRAEVGRDASLDWVALGFGSASGRVRMETRLGGEGADARVTGAYATHARQHIDFDTTQEHAAPNTTSDLAFRGVLQGRSSAVWKGNIIVDPGAQKTDAFQESRNLLISKRAHADAIPGLEIQANDVRCTHAAAVAQVDPEQLFYLRSHGLEDEVAKRLVIEGFLAALVERFEQGTGPRGAGRRARAPARAGPRRLTPTRPGRYASVETIRTLQRARCETLFGTLPSTNREALCMPLLPTTIMSAPTFSATSSSASAGSFSSAWVVTSTFFIRIPAAAWLSVDSTCESGSGCQTFAAPSGAPAILAPRSGSNADTTWTSAPNALASRTASSTARFAVSEPSVPTTIASAIL